MRGRRQEGASQGHGWRGSNSAAEELKGDIPRAALKPSKSVLLCPVGLAQVGLEECAWWPGAFQQVSLCAGQEEGGGKDLLRADLPVFGQPHKQALGLWSGLPSSAGEQGLPSLSRGVQAQS